jgi:hypothetical protein
VTDHYNKLALTMLLAGEIVSPWPFIVARRLSSKLDNYVNTQHMPETRMIETLSAQRLRQGPQQLDTHRVIDGTGR